MEYSNAARGGLSLAAPHCVKTGASDAQVAGGCVTELQDLSFPNLLNVDTMNLALSCRINGYYIQAKVALNDQEPLDSMDRMDTKVSY